MTKKEQIENEKRIAKREEIARTHPDRLLSTEKKKKTIREIVKEGKTKGYTMFPCDKLEEGYQGLILFKEIDGIELAYNPMWPAGKLGVTTIQLLKEFNLYN